MAALPRWKSAGARARNSKGLQWASSDKPLAGLPPAALPRRPRAARSSIAPGGIRITEMIAATAKATASQNTAGKPNVHPTSPESPAPTTLPA
jgi:hypothetical protein